MGHNIEIEYWEECKKHLRNHISPALYQSIISPISPSMEKNVEPNNLRLQKLELCVPNQKIATRLSQRYLPMIKNFFSEIPLQYQVSIRIANKPDKNVNEPIVYQEKNTEPYNQRANQQNKIADSNFIQNIEKRNIKKERSHFSNSCIKDCSSLSGGNFCIPQVNLFQIERLWREPTTLYHMYGKEGSGKSTIGAAFVKSQEELGRRSQFLKFEAFLSDLAVVARNRDSVNWRKRLREYECLVIDDFHYIKPNALRSQEELLYLIDYFLQAGKCIMFCTDRPVSQMKLTPPLLSRLQAARKIPLCYPEQKERERILKQENENYGLHLKKELSVYLSKRISRDMRRLKSAVWRIAEFHSYSNTIDNPELTIANIGLDFLDRECQDLYTKTTEMTPQAVIQIVADFYKISPKCITGPARDKRYSLARHVVAYFCTNYLKMNLKESAQVIGRQDHASASHARNKVEKLMERDLFFRRQLQELFLQIQS